MTTAGIEALTEKEKETLRLLVSGYDAKSMARHLGLSVHTVNERLRDARRKLAVSSSREAARQLRAIEHRDPQILGDKALGEAAAAPGVEERAASVEVRRMGRRSGWIAGGLFMSLAFALLAFASMSGSADAPAAPPATAPAESPATGSRWSTRVTGTEAGKRRASRSRRSTPPKPGRAWRGRCRARWAR